MSSTRRADWRFLLPRPDTQPFRRLLLLGGTPQQAQQLISSALASDVTLSPDHAARYDAVVILAGADAHPEHVVGMLEPHGCVYWEVDRRKAAHHGLTPRGACDRLRSSGLVPTASHWALPGFERCDAYLPIGALGASAWFWSAVRRASPLRRLVYTTGLAVAERAGGPLGFRGAPCFAVVAMRGEARGSEGLLRYPDVPPSIRSRASSEVLLASGNDDFGRVVLLPFAPHGTRPLAVLKAPRLPERNDSVRVEQQALVRMRDQLSPNLRQSIPRPLGMLRFGELLIGVETCAPGRLLSGPDARGGTRRRVGDLRLVSAWLAEFQRQLRFDDPRLTERMHHEWLLQPLRVYEETFERTPAESALFASLRECIRASDARAIPIVMQHGGFTDRNIYRRGQRITVIDWEEARPGLPLLDLVYFVTHWYASVTRASRGLDDPSVLRRLFLASHPPDRFAADARMAIREYCSALQIPRQVVPVLHVLTWVERAIGRARREQWRGATTLASRDTNRYAAFVSAIADAGEALWAD